MAKDSPVRSFSGLRGGKFAFTDPLSNSGRLVPTYMLAKMNETPESFFGSFIFTKSHDKAIKAVAQGIVDAAAVDSLIWEYLNNINPEFTSKTRIIEKSPPYDLGTAHEADPRQPYAVKELTTDKGVILDFGVPLFAGEIGVLHMGISKASIREDVNDIVMLIILFSLFVMIAGSIAAAVFSNVITRPILRLAGAAAAFKKGSNLQNSFLILSGGRESSFFPLKLFFQLSKNYFTAESLCDHSF